MKKILGVSVILGILLGMQSVNASPMESSIEENKVPTISEESSDSFRGIDNQGYTNPKAANPDARLEQIVFDFDNSYDYGTCLDAILLTYENRGLELQKAAKNDCTDKIFSVLDGNLSKDTALQLIELADYHATTELDIKLYPSLGLRRRVAINFGYIYDIDKSNNEVLKYLSSNQ